jgi:hypothetical protein
MDDTQGLIKEADTLAILLMKEEGGLGYLGGKVIYRLIDHMRQLEAKQATSMPMIAEAGVQPSLFDNLPPIIDLTERDKVRQQIARRDTLIKTLVVRWKEVWGTDVRVPTHLILDGFNITQDQAEKSARCLKRQLIAQLFAEIVDPRIADADVSSREKGKLIEWHLDEINVRLNQYLFYPVHDNGRYFVLSCRSTVKNRPVRYEP